MRLRVPQALATRLAWWRCLPLGCFFLAAVCGACKPTTKVETAEVSGTVKLKGKPLPGGRVTFIADKGGYTGAAIIGKDGSYKVTDAPVGPVHITVDNRMLQPKRGPTAAPPKRPDMANPAGPEDVKGDYVSFPDKYATANKTDLTYTVVSGPQTHDVEVP